MNELAWTASFAESYVVFLDKKDQELYFAIAKIKLLFQRKKYHEVLLLLSQYQSLDKLTNIDLRIIQIKVYFELKMFNLAEASLTNFTTYINRNKHKLFYYKQYKNFVQFLRELLEAKINNSKHLHHLQEMLFLDKKLLHREWLNTQIELQNS